LRALGQTPRDRKIEALTEQVADLVRRLDAVERTRRSPHCPRVQRLRPTGAGAVQRRQPAAQRGVSTGA
jgi:hypothetical protein